jgi:hypothetical protein
MRGLRIFLLRHRALAALALALVLSVRLLVPSGYMVAGGARMLTVVVCTGVTGEHETMHVMIPTAGQKSGHDGGHEGSKADPCPYSSLSMISTAGVDAPLIAAALAFIMALGFAPIVTSPRKRVHYVRPPLRGPPVVA